MPGEFIKDFFSDEAAHPGLPMLVRDTMDVPRPTRITDADLRILSKTAGSTSLSALTDPDIHSVSSGITPPTAQSAPSTQTILPPNRSWALGTPDVITPHLDAKTGRPLRPLPYSNQ